MNVSPAASTPNFESSLLLELEDSPNLFSNSINNSSCLSKSEKSPLHSLLSKRSQDLKLNDESGDLSLFEEKKRSEDILTAKANLEQMEEKGEKSKSERNDEIIKGEKSKSPVDDDKDMFENESENLLSSDDIKGRDTPNQNNFDDNENVLEPIAGPSKTSEESLTQKAILATDSLKSFLDISDEASLIEEQIKIAKQIEQEKKDMEMARKLQLQLDKESRSVDRRKGSENGYSFRVATPKSVTSNKKRRRNSSGKKDKSQMSIQDSFKRTKLNFKESDELAE